MLMSQEGEARDDTAPSIEELVDMEDIDILSYMGFEGDEQYVQVRVYTKYGFSGFLIDWKYIL